MAKKIVIVQKFVIVKNKKNARSILKNCQQIVKKNGEKFVQKKVKNLLNKWFNFFSFKKWLKNGQNIVESNVNYLI
jgi:hypothetical protein